MSSKTTHKCAHIPCTCQIPTKQEFCSDAQGWPGAQKSRSLSARIGSLRCARICYLPRLISIAIWLVIRSMTMISVGYLRRLATSDLEDRIGKEPVAA